MYENGTNIGNVPECNECRTYELEIARLAREYGDVKTRCEQAEALLWETLSRLPGHMSGLHKRIREFLEGE